jgi:hypothetical protein
MASSGENRPVPLAQLLTILGDTYGRFFTIEEGWKAGEPMNSLEARQVRQPSENKGLGRELEQLRQTVTDFTYQVSTTNPRIVHIIDSRLVQQKGYGLESTLKTIDFVGPTSDLVVAIGQQGIPVATQRALFTNEFQDYATVVRAKGNGLKVRDALSTFLPLDERKGRILWIARTKLARGELTYVYFPPAGKKS